jgi:hypothetical protein
MLSDPHEQTVLRTSIQDYLKRRHPKDTQNLEMLSLHFSVFSDIGLNRMQRAQALLERTVPAKMNNPTALLRDLDLVLQVADILATAFGSASFISLTLLHLSFHRCFKRPPPTFSRRITRA